MHGVSDLGREAFSNLKTLFLLSIRQLLLLALLAITAALASGCTSALWDKETFAQHYRPAFPANLRLAYSDQRRDILVQYSESHVGYTNIRTRCYWLEPNIPRVNRNQKPRFVSGSATNGLTPIPLSEDPPNPVDSGPIKLYVMARRGDDFFTLYSNKEKLDPYKLPVYTGPSQRVKQVLLTPFAAVVDVTIFGAIISYYAAPSILADLVRR